MSNFTELKQVVIENLLNQLSDKDKEDIGKEFNLTKEQIESLTVKMLDKWLNNQDFVLFIATTLGLSMPRKTKEKRARYIG